MQQTWVWHRPLEDVAINSTRATRAYAGLGKQTLGQHKQNLMCTRTHEKEAVTPQETEPDLPVRVQESPKEMLVDSGLLLGQGHSIQQSGHKSY